MYHFAGYFVGDPQTAENIVQDVFVKIWTNREKLFIQSSPKAYLYKAVKNKSINYLKSKYANIHFEEENAIFNIADFFTPEHEYEIKELKNSIDTAKKKLPDKCYHIFSLSRYSSLSNKQIAQQLNISEKTVENQITIALKKIKSFLDKQL